MKHFLQEYWPVAQELRAKGFTYEKIARLLNEKGARTVRGAHIANSQVSALFIANDIRVIKTRKGVKLKATTAPRQLTLGSEDEIDSLVMEIWNRKEIPKEMRKRILNVIIDTNN